MNRGRKFQAKETKWQGDDMRKHRLSSEVQGNQNITKHSKGALELRAQHELMGTQRPHHW